MALRGRIWTLRRETVALAVLAGAAAILLTWSGLRELQADSFRLLYTGRWIAQHGLPHREVFTIAGGGHAYVDQQWLAELLTFEVWRAGGYEAVVALSALVFGLGYGVLAVLLRRRASLPVVTAAVSIAILGGLSVTFVRAQLFALPLFVLLLWLCLNDSRRARFSWQILLAVPLLALWANLHGSVLIGAAAASVYFAYRAVALGRSSRHDGLAYLALAAAAALMPLATPYGLHALAYYREMLGNPVVARADIEWDPPQFPALSFFQFLLPLLVASASTLAALLRGRRPPAPLLIAVALCAAAGAIAMRNDIWLAIAAAAVFAETAPAWIPTAAPSTVFRSAIAALAVGLGGAVVAVVATRSGAAYESHAPLRELAAARTYLADHRCAEVLADNTSASALLWLDPSAAGRVAFDGELEAYPQRALTDWVTFQSATSADWIDATRDYQLLIGTRADHPALARRLAELRGAAVVHADSRGIAVAVPGPQPSGNCEVQHA